MIYLEHIYIYIYLRMCQVYLDNVTVQRVCSFLLSRHIEKNRFFIIIIMLNSVASQMRTSIQLDRYNSSRNTAQQMAQKA